MPRPDCGADSAAGHTKRREAKMPKDQNVGDGDVDDVGHDRGRQRRPAVTGAAQDGAADEGEKQRHAGRGGDPQVGRRRRGDIRLGAEKRDDRRCGEVHRDRNRNREQNSPDDRLPREVIGTMPFPGTDSLGDENRRPDIDRRQDRDDEEDDLESGPDPGNGCRAQASHHQGVDSRDHGLQQVFADDRCRQRQHAALRHRFVSRLIQWRWPFIFIRKQRRGLDLGGFEHALDCRVHAPSQIFWSTWSVDRHSNGVILRNCTLHERAGPRPAVRSSVGNVIFRRLRVRVSFRRTCRRNLVVRRGGERDPRDSTSSSAAQNDTLSVSRKREPCLAVPGGAGLRRGWRTGSPRQDHHAGVRLRKFARSCTRHHPRLLRR